MDCRWVLMCVGICSLHPQASGEDVGNCLPSCTCMWLSAKLHMLVAAHQPAYVRSCLPNCTSSTTHNTSQLHISYGTYVTSKLYWLLSNSSDICHSVCHYNTCDTHCDGTRDCLVGWNFYHLKGSCDWKLSCFRYCLHWQYVCSSLLNIYQELRHDIPGFEAPRHGNLIGWARQGECAWCCGWVTDYFDSKCLKLCWVVWWGVLAGPVDCSEWCSVASQRTRIFIYTAVKTTELGKHKLIGKQHVDRMQDSGAVSRIVLT
jgi:hypothetical protein